LFYVLLAILAQFKNFLEDVFVTGWLYICMCVCVCVCVYWYWGGEWSRESVIVVLATLGQKELEHLSCAQGSIHVSLSSSLSYAFHFIASLIYLFLKVHFWFRFTGALCFAVGLAAFVYR